MGGHLTLSQIVLLPLTLPLKTSSKSSLHRSSVSLPVFLPPDVLGAFPLLVASPSADAIVSWRDIRRRP